MLSRPAISAITLTFLISLLPIATKARQDTHVKGYTRKGNTPVRSYKRKAPNKTKLDNYGTKGNLNPNTGKVGKEDRFTGKGERR